MQEEMILNRELVDMSDEQIDVIKQAIHVLSNSTQEQFDEIRKEKWFNRLFDIITFSQKKNIRVAEQISSLAQAQEILMQLLLRVSNLTPEISKAVLNAESDILTLSRQNIRLEHQIIQLQDNLYKRVSGIDLSAFSQSQKIALYGCLKKISDSIEETSSEQQEFANAVIDELNTDDYVDEPFELLETLPSDDIKVIAYCCMEYIFLSTCNSDSFEAHEEIIDEFDLGKKTLLEIKNRIESNYKLRGVAGLQAKYGPLKSYGIDDQFYVMLDDFDDIPIEFETIDISRITTINCGESVIYTNKIVNISAIIQCKGVLEFENCEIYFKDSPKFSFIDMESGSRLSVKGSKINTVVDAGNESKKYINTAENVTSCFESCEFNNCSNLLNADGPLSVLNCEFNDCKKLISCYNIFSFTDCNVYSMGSYFIESYVSTGKVTDISNNHFEFASPDENSYSLIKIDPHWSVNDNDSISAKMKNNYFKMIKSDDDTDGNKKGSINAIDIEHCTFDGLDGIDITCEKLKNSLFVDCRGVESVMFAYSDGSGFVHAQLIDQCRFTKCETIISYKNLDKKTKIENCQFDLCHGSLIHSEGYTEVENCNFYCINGEKKHNVYGDFRPVAAIDIVRSGNSNPPSRIYRCNFDGIITDDGYLICSSEMEYNTKYSILVSECRFSNCSSIYGSKGIIKTNVQYFGFGSKEKEYKAIDINNCSGLDNVLVKPVDCAISVPDMPGVGANV